MKFTRSIITSILLLLIAGCISPELRTARIAINDREWNRALVSLNVEEARLPSAEVYYLRGFCYEKRSNWTLMSENYTRSLEMSPMFKDKIEPSRARLVRRYFDLSVTAYDSAGALMTDGAQGETPELVDKQWHLSLAALDTAMLIDPTATVLFSQTSITAYYAHEYEKAMEYSLKAIETEGDTADIGVREVLLSIYKDREDTTKIIEAAKDLMEVVDPTADINTYLNAFDALLGTYMGMGNTAESAKITTAAINLFPDNMLLKFNLAILLIKQKKDDLAAEILSEIIQVEPENLEANLQLGTILSGKEEWNEAIPYLEKAHELDSSNRYCVQNLMAAYYNSGRDKEGMEMKKKLDALLEGK